MFKHYTLSHKQQILALLVLFLQTATIYCQSQSFDKKPVDTSVKIGDTALLTCSVSEKHGDVQWTHDGTALGYDRQIPGKPRYSVIFDKSEATEYHLEIKNVTMDDEGTFSCQAAPIGDWDTKLEAKAKLTVLVGPEKAPEILFGDEIKRPGEIVNFRSMSDAPTKYTCVIRRSKPAGTISWFLNGTLIASKVGTTKTTTFKNEEDGMEDFTSELTLVEKHAVHNNSIIECQVYHAAFGIKNKLANMSSSIHIVVVQPPSKPKISGYDNSTGVIAGSDLKLICASHYTYPSAMLSWYRDSVLVSKNYDTIQSLQLTESVYRIAKVTPADNRAVFKCDAINPALDEPLTTGLVLNVLYGPTKLTMEGTFEVEAGQQISARCFSDAANPSPKLRYSFDGHDYEPSAFSSNPTDAKVAVGAYTVNGTFVQTVRQEHNNKELKCYAENKLANVQQIVTKVITVLYAPDTLDIIFEHVNETITEGTRVFVTCVSRGGNPLPDIEWSIVGSDEKLTGARSQSIIYTRESVLELVLERKHHGKTLQCRAANKVGSMTKFVVLSVAYLPVNVNISIIQPTSTEFQLFSNISMNAGTRAIFVCNAPNSNPRSHITWYRNNFPVIFTNPALGSINETFTYNSATNDYSTISHISFLPDSSDHLKELKCSINVAEIQRTMHGSLLMDIKFAPELLKPPSALISVYENKTFTLNLAARANPPATYSCKATNKKTYNLTNTTILTFNADRTDNTEFTCLLTNAINTTKVTFKLDVKFQPTAKVKKAEYISTVGEQVQLTCQVTGNPLEHKHITWKLNDKILTNSNDQVHYSVKFIPPDQSILQIDNVRPTDDGNFTCHVYNKIGVSVSDKTELRVKRIPKILTDRSVLKAGEDGNIGRSARFECRAKGYPDVKFKWKEPNNVDIINSTKYALEFRKETNQEYVSVLTVNEVVSKDYGQYLCEARSEIGAIAEKALLSGKHQPEQPSDFRVVNITRNTIMLRWKKHFDGGDSQKFRIRYRKDTMDPTYRYIETNSDVETILLDNLETATRYVINIQSLNRFGTDGFLREPLVVQTDFGFNEVNQMPIYNENNLPLTIILIVCGVGTMLLLFNVALIVYLIKRKKKKGEADSTTDTNETDANIVEMFSPPPPYPEEINYHHEDEYKPFVPHLQQQQQLNKGQIMQNGSIQHKQHLKYVKSLSQQNPEYAFGYAWEGINHGLGGNEVCDDDEGEDVHISSLRRLDHNISAALQHQDMSSTLLNTANRHLSSNRPFGGGYNNINNSFNLNLGQVGSGDDYLMEARAFPYERLSHQGSGQSNQMFKANSNCKIYQDLDEFKGHLV